MYVHEHNSSITTNNYKKLTLNTFEVFIIKKIINMLGSGDTLVVTKLDILARNTVEGIQIVQQLFDKGVTVHVLNIWMLENTSIGKFLLTTLLAVSRDGTEHYNWEDTNR